MNNLKRAFIISVSLLCNIVTIASAETVTYFHNDISGSPIVASDASGTLRWRESYQPYGEKLLGGDPDYPSETSNTGTAQINKIGFHGKPFDDSTGLSYIGARYYNPIVGRFVSVDPEDVVIENIHSFNRYAYANNNPYKYVDPDGHSPLDVAFLIFDLGKLAMAVASGSGIAAAGADVAISAVGVISPVPFAGQALKAARGVERGAEAASGASKAAKTLEANKIAGHEAEAATRTKLAAQGQEVTEQVTFLVNGGKNRTRIDFVARKDGKVSVVETKSGSAVLSKGQKAFQQAVENGQTVVPVGKNAEAAGFQVGVPVKIESFSVDRIVTGRGTQ
ncbi:hypothetical protein GE543_12435 [Pseudomonas sp. SZ57]|uniref:RHS repeat domain-containing protein n=1 Tax=Pseudomonas TaxID=286 RepID=UPI000EFFD33B|nr:MULTISPECIES: RHS repeat-associated core domain-containing protein [Pseudomonas]MCL6310338.1 RHS domain-containing protein [Pseudomonas syringae]MQQ35117.1 hypothetical protein [Pseudomonas sp. SZ57]